MSRKVIQRLVMPIIQPQLQAMKPIKRAKIEEPLLEDHFERELIQNFGIVGSANHCEKLEESIKETQKRDPVLFEKYLLQLLEKFVNQLAQKHAELAA